MILQFNTIIDTFITIYFEGRITLKLQHNSVAKMECKLFVVVVIT